MVIAHALAGQRTLAEVRDAAGHVNVSTMSAYLHIATWMRQSASYSDGEPAACYINVPHPHSQRESACPTGVVSN
jgi:hypothetical protein